MSRLFNRVVEIETGQPGQPGKQWSNLDFSFLVTKTLRRSSNKATVTLFNLSDDSIGEMEEKGTVLTLRAGYPETIALLFSGDIAKRGVETTFDNKDKTTVIRAGAHEVKLRNSRTDFGFGPGVTAAEIIKQVAKVLNVGEGNLNDLAAFEYANGFTHVGLVRSLLTEISNDLDVAWSIQSGQLRFLGLDEATSDEAVLLTPSTGLVGSPTITKRGIKARSLINPDITPGRLVKVVARGVDGFFKVRKATFFGAIPGSDFYVDLEGKAIG